MATSDNNDNENKYEYDEEDSLADDAQGCDTNSILDDDDDDNNIDSDDEYIMEGSDDDDDDAHMTKNDSNANMTWESTELDNASKRRKGDCIRMLPSSEMIPEMVSRLQEVKEVLNVPTIAAKVLLGAHKWSKPTLLEKYYNDPDALLKECGVYYRCNPIVKKPAPKTRKSKAKLCCPICYEDGVTMWGMPCGHEFCQDCWHDFCTNAIGEGLSCLRVTCPEAKCTEVIAEEEVAVAVPNLLAKYLSYQLRSFVDSDVLTWWCPGNGCDLVACVSSATALELARNVAHCDSCMTSFCMLCGDEPHRPTSCKELLLWRDKCRDESETANWILTNTKSCPKCVTRIEKNQGCNHMTCRQCRFEFCWICMADWSGHGYNYTCNKFDSDGPGDKSEVAKAKRELDRYLHYYKRYDAHAQAQVFAGKQLKVTKERLDSAPKTANDAKWSDVEYLKAANVQLVECRRVLKFTYVFGYYLTNTQAMQRERFEHHQEMLEKFTEKLSELSEKPVDEVDRLSVVNQTRAIEQFVTNILQYVEDGMDDLEQ